MNLKAKTFDETFIYRKGNYGEAIFAFLMSSTRVDKTAEGFQDLRREVKSQQSTSVLLKVMDSDKVVFMINNTPMSRAFKVFIAKDPKDTEKTKKAFIDVSGLLLATDGGDYTFNRRSITTIVAYLLSAMNAMIYEADPQRIIGNASIIKYGTPAFAKLFTYLIDYLRIGGIDKIRETTLFMASMYFQVNLLQKEPTDTVLAKAKSVSGLEDSEIGKINFLLRGEKGNIYQDINTFVHALSVVLRTEKLTIDVIIDKWMFLFGSGTQFATEMYTSFSDMLSNTYVGAYLNHQNTIEKIIPIEMTEYVKTILQIGSAAL